MSLARLEVCPWLDFSWERRVGLGFVLGDSVRSGLGISLSRVVRIPLKAQSGLMGLKTRSYFRE